MSVLDRPLRTLIVGLGKMGRSHALAYHNNPGFEIVGLVNRSPIPLPHELRTYPLSDSYEADLAALQPDVVSINTYSESHADYAIAAMKAGAHVFVEKPLATTAEDARRVVATAKETGKKLVVGYILRHHPSWQTLIAEARKMGGPLRVPPQSQPAILRPDLADAQERDAHDLADRRLRRPLCRRDVPDH
jgi:predicted dehydrogenase